MQDWAQRVGGWVGGLGARCSNHGWRHWRVGQHALGGGGLPPSKRLDAHPTLQHARTHTHTHTHTHLGDACVHGVGPEAVVDRG